MDLRCIFKIIPHLLGDPAYSDFPERNPWTIRKGEKEVSSEECLVYQATF